MSKMYDIDTIVEEIIDRYNSHISQRFRRACGQGDLQLINALVEEGADNFNSGLICACYCGHLNVIDRLVELGANMFDAGMIEACYFGDLDVIMKMIELGANDVYYALDKLIFFGHFYVAKKFIELCVIIRKKDERHHEEYKKYDEWEKINRMCSEYFGSDIYSVIIEY